MSWLSTITSWIPGGGLVKAVSGALKSWQDRKAQEQATKARWELTQAKRSSTVLRWATFTILWGPILQAYVLALRSLPDNAGPDAIAGAVSATVGAFPPWWTGGAMTVLLAVWGIREAGHAGITKAAMRVQEKEAEAETERERNKRTGPPNGGP